MIDAAFFTALFLVFLRILTFFIVAQVFFPKSTPNMLKIGLCIILSYIILSSINYSSLTETANSMVFFMYCFNEVMTGIILGAIVNLCFMSLQVAGNLIDMQIGFSMVTMFDPNSNSNSTLIEKILYWFSIVIFFIVDGHHMLIKQLVESFKIISLGKNIVSQDSMNIIIKAFTEFFSIGLKIAIPIVLIIIITDLTMGLVARTVPQLNIMILGLPVKILVGFLSVSFAFPMFLKFIELNFQGIQDAFRALFKLFPVMFIFASDDKTEEATPHKKSEARKKGQVAKSKEVGLALTLMASTMAVAMLGDYSSNNLKNLMVAFLTDYLNYNIDYSSLKKLSILIVIKIGMIVLPIALLVMAVGVAANLAQTGFLVTKEPLKPDIKKLNPINGFKRIFSMRTVMELLKDISIITVTGIVGFNFVKDNYKKILSINSLKFSAIISVFLELIKNIFFKITLVMLIIALADYIFQRLQYNKDLKMTKQEVKEEFKQQEGDPAIKSKIRHKQREMAMKRMMQEVPKATVVVTNPTHLAVAIKYEKGDSAPTVVAKGADYVAIKIKDLAKKSEVPIIENKPLARLLYSRVEIDEEVPVDMYQAVAETLAIVYKLKNKK